MNQRIKMILVSMLALFGLMMVVACQPEDHTAFTEADANAHGSTTVTYSGAGVCGKTGSTTDFNCWKAHTGPSNGDTQTQIQNGTGSGTYHHLGTSSSPVRIDINTYPASGAATATQTPYSGGSAVALTSSDGWDSSTGTLSGVYLDGCINVHAAATTIANSLVVVPDSAGCGPSGSTSNGGIWFDENMTTAGHTYGGYSNVTFGFAFVDSTEITSLNDRADGMAGIDGFNYVAGHVDIHGFSKGLWLQLNTSLSNPLAKVHDSMISALSSVALCVGAQNDPNGAFHVYGDANTSSSTPCAAYVSAGWAGDVGPHQEAIFANGVQGISTNHVVFKHNWISTRNAYSATAAVFQGAYQGVTPSKFQDLIDNYIEGGNGYNIFMDCSDRGNVYEANVFSDINTVGSNWDGVGGGTYGYNGNPSVTDPNRWYSSGLDNQSPRQPVVRNGSNVPQDAQYTWNIGDGTWPMAAGWQDIPNPWDTATCAP